MPDDPQHPELEPTGSVESAAAVPDPLFDDPSTEARWKARFSAVRMSLPVSARDAEQRALFVSNESGRYELYSWDVTGDRRWQATDRPAGTVVGALSANGQGLWWFDDHDGDEFGKWMAQPFGAAAGSAGEAIPGIAPGYPAGIEIGQRVVLLGFTDDDGSRVHLARGGRATEVVYRHPTDAAVGALSADEQVWVLEHTEHGDTRYPALRAIGVDDGEVRAELTDAPGKGLSCLDFSPIPGDQRLLVGHERRGRDELLIWDIETGDVRELDLDLPGDLSGSFFRDAQALLVQHSHAGGPPCTGTTSIRVRCWLCRPTPAPSTVRSPGMMAASGTAGPARHTRPSRELCRPPTTRPESHRWPAICWFQPAAGHRTLSRCRMSGSTVRVAESIRCSRYRPMRRRRTWTAAPTHRYRQCSWCTAGPTPPTRTPSTLAGHSGWKPDSPWCRSTIAVPAVTARSGAMR